MRLPFSTHRETYVWYALDVAAERPPRPLPPGLELVAAPPDEHGSISWEARGEDATAFGCWIHPRRTPLRALPGGYLEMPSRVACLEDSWTAPQFRGQGIAPAAWTEVAGRVQDVDTIVTKIRDDNIASRKGVEKVGFREVAQMEVLQNGPLVRLSCSASDQVAAFLVERLDGARRLVRD